MPGWPGQQPSRASQRERLEDMEARQLEELRKAEVASRQAEMEAIMSRAARAGEEISQEDLETIDWNRMEESFAERVIRKSGRWGETLLILGQAARWAMVVLMTVLVVVVLVYALDRSANNEQIIGMGAFDAGRTAAAAPGLGTQPTGLDLGTQPTGLDPGTQRSGLDPETTDETPFDQEI